MENWNNRHIPWALFVSELIGTTLLVLVGLSLVILMFGADIPVARVAGIALIALGLACWPGTPLVGMLIYSVAVTLYLTYLGIRGAWVGVLLWPAVVIHAILTFVLTRTWLKDRQSKE